MTAMAPLRDILNDTPADAVDVQWNFQNLEGFVNTELINRDGSVAMEQPLVLAGPAPSQPNHAATKGYVDGSIPVGVIWQYAGPVAPPGWALCDGTSKTTTDPLYAALFAVIGYTYGGATGNFLLPNFQNRIPAGKGSAAWSNVLGETGGTKDQTLLQHNHTATQGTHSHTTPDHRHELDHDHASVASGIESAGHVHGTAGVGGQYFGHTSSGSGVVHTGTGPNAWIDLSALTTGGVSANHTHSVNVPAFTGLTPWGGASNTETKSAGAITVANAGALASGTDANLPPYLTVNFIIRL